MSQPDEHRKRADLFALWPIATSVAASLGIMIIAGVLILELRANVGRRAQETAENILRLVERDIERNIETLDLALQGIVDGLARPEVVAAKPDIRDLVLLERSARGAGLVELVVLDPSGAVKLSTGVPDTLDHRPHSDREYFNVHIAADPGLHISRPHRSRATGEEVVALTRRIVDPDGKFGGVALATIRLSYLHDVMSRLQLGSDGVVTLFRSDGAVLLRESARPQIRYETAPTSVLERLHQAETVNYVARSSIDGVERLYTSSHVGSLPLIVVIGLATADIYGRFAREAVAISLILTLICSGLIGLTVRLTRELGRRATAERALTAMNAELARLSVTDGLTGLRNRRNFDETLGRELRRAGRSGTKLTLLLIDLDHFKSFNDRYGHQGGDEALVAFGGVLARSCRIPGSRAFRIGGEEFALLLPESGRERGMRVAEQIRVEVQTLALTHAGSPSGRLTTSIGVAEVQDCGPAAAYARADAALYRAKEAGRDRVAGAEPPRKAA